MTMFADAATKEAALPRIDRFGIVIAILLATALTLPFATFRATRIASGNGLWLFSALPMTMALAVTAVLAAAPVAVGEVGRVAQVAMETHLERRLRVPGATGW